MTDQFDRAKAKANVEDAVTRFPDITAWSACLNTTRS